MGQQNVTGQQGSNSGVGHLILDWGRLNQDLELSSETLRGYTQQGFQAPGDQSQRLSQVYGCLAEVRQLFQVPDIANYIRNYIAQHGGQMPQTMGASASSFPNTGGRTQGSPDTSETRTG